MHSNPLIYALGGCVATMNTYKQSIGPDFVETLIQQANDKVNSLGYLFDGNFRDNNIRGNLSYVDKRHQLGEEDCRRSNKHGYIFYVNASPPL